jgi:hypothetical protein
MPTVLYLLHIWLWALQFSLRIYRTYDVGDMLNTVHMYLTLWRISTHRYILYEYPRRLHIYIHV